MNFSLITIMIPAIELFELKTIKLQLWLINAAEESIITDLLTFKL